MMKHRSWLTLSYEGLRAELDQVVGRYRAHSADDRDTLTREEAVRRIRKLGFTAGDAFRWLGSKPRGGALHQVDA
jgi:hypothetical protein